MRSLVKFLTIFTSILVVSALLAPFLFDILPFKFERIFNRLIMIFSLVAIVIFVRFRKETFKNYGLVWRHDSFRLLLTGLGAGVVTLVLLAGLKLALGKAVMSIAERSLLAWGGIGIKLLMTGLLIGVIEEFFFRGFIFSNLRKRFGWNIVLSVIVTSVFYSLIHFISKSKPFIGPDPTVLDSFRLMAAPFSSLLEWHSFWPAAVGLFLFGVILNDLVIRSGSLYPSIGLHAGCVLFIKMDGLLIDYSRADVFLFASDKMYDGVLGWVFLIVMWGVLRVFIRPQANQE